MLRRIFQKLQPSLRSNFWRSSKSLYTGKGRIKRPRAVQPFFLPQGGQRRYGTGTGLVPRGFILRVFWTSITAATGYFYYQVGQASTWMTQKIELLHTLGMESLLEALNVWDNLSVAIEESLAWNPFSWKSKTKEVHNSLDRKPATPLGDSAPSDGVNNNDDGGFEVEVGTLEQFRDFIKRMIEVRNILKTAGMDEKLNLPSIVVIGSQSSGKSSVLESIVGHEFLPKGQNMVTRRPLELTLVNSPGCPRDYAVFEHLGTGPIYDFSQVQKTLKDLNLAVGDTQWISSKPIELTIYSRHVPDLSLVDLPGYIQINNRNQPSILRERITQLCDKYIRQDNIILAVCPADVDLANAEALKASRVVDPNGMRTIGVITKLDLVDADYAAKLVKNEDYPLRLGYVGVICRPPEDAPQPRALALLARKSALTASNYEEAYVKEHREAFETVRGRLGIGSLRDRLSAALESSMVQALSTVSQVVAEELTELRYLLKVEYSDRVISPEGYVSFLAASVKNGLESVAREYSRPRVREQLRSVLHDRLLSVAEEIFWTGNAPAGMVGEEHRLNQAVAILTRSGVGRLAATTLVDAIIRQVEQVIKDGPLSHHPTAKERLLKQVEATMKARAYAAVEQVENAIKPLKHELEYTDEDWRQAYLKTLRLLHMTEAELDRKLRILQGEVGQKRLRKVIKQLTIMEGSKDVSSTNVDLINISPPLAEKAREAVRLNFRLCGIRRRLAELEKANCALPERDSSNTRWSWFNFSKGANSLDHQSSNLPPTLSSNSSSNPFSLNNNNRRNQSVIMDAGTDEAKTVHVWNTCQIKCPEVYLYLVMERLLTTSALYVHHELVHEFLHPFPDELAASLGASGSGNVMGLDRKEILCFVQENATVARHLQLQERRRILERVKDKLSYLEHFQKSTDDNRVAL